MGSSTQGYLSYDISAIDVYNVIVNKFDKNAKHDIKSSSYDGTEEGSIFFKYNDEDRRLFCCKGEETEDVEFNGDYKYTYLSIGVWGSSVQIVADIVKCFGGYINANDDNEDSTPVYIIKSENYDYSEHIEKRNKVINILDKNINEALKIQIAEQILKHKNQILEMFK